MTSLTDLPDDVVYKIADGAVRTTLYQAIARKVSERFRSIHYMSSTLVTQCVLLNLLFNDEILPHSASRVLTIMRRRTKSLYSTVDSSYKCIEVKFAEYAKTVLGDEYDYICSLDLRSAEFIVYVISRDIASGPRIDRKEALYAALCYADLDRYGLK